MKWDDLLGAPYKVRGRGDGGYDCYGLVIECCRRAGTPLRDVWDRECGCDAAQDVIALGENVTEVPHAAPGEIAVMDYAGQLHCGYVVDHGLILHTTEKGVRVTPARAMKVLHFYAVKGE